MQRSGEISYACMKKYKLLKNIMGNILPFQINYLNHRVFTTESGGGNKKRNCNYKHLGTAIFGFIILEDSKLFCQSSLNIIKIEASCQCHLYEAHPFKPLQNFVSNDERMALWRDREQTDGLPDGRLLLRQKLNNLCL